METYFLIIAFAGGLVMPERYSYDECHEAGKRHDGTYRCILAPSKKVPYLRGCETRGNLSYCE